MIRGQPAGISTTARTALGLVSAALAVACANPSPPRAAATPPPAAAVPATSPGEGPRLVVEPPAFDFGTVVAGREIEKEFVIKNHGRALLAIDSVTTSCACAVAQGYARTVAPGRDTVLRARVTMPPGPGHIQRLVLIRTNDPTRPSFELKLDADVVAAASRAP